MATAQEKLDLLDTRILEVLSSPMGNVEVTVDGTTVKGDKADVLLRLEKIRSVYALRVIRAATPGTMAPGITLTYRGRYDVV